MAKKKKSARGPHCKKITKANGKTGKMCFINGKLTSAAKVKAAKARG